jgi:hypothetical protein
MAQLSYPSPTEVQLRLGPHENAILAVVRGWAWWTHVAVEGQVAGDATVSAVVLTAERSSDMTIREILQRSFQLVFPPEGGERVLAAPPAAQVGTGRRRTRV